MENIKTSCWNNVPRMYIKCANVQSGSYRLQYFPVHSNVQLGVLCANVDICGMSVWGCVCVYVGRGAMS